MKIYLIGYIGSGKSTLGKILAQEQDMNFIDFDDFGCTEKISASAFYFGTLCDNSRLWDSNRRIVEGAITVDGQSAVG